MHDCSCGCWRACDCDMDDTWLNTPTNCISIGCGLCLLDCFNCICHEYDEYEVVDSAAPLTPTERNPSARDGAYPFGGGE